MTAQPSYEAYGLAGAYAPPALKGVDNPTFAHRPPFASSGRPVDKQGYPPRALPPEFFNFLFMQSQRGGAAGRARAGGTQSPRGSGGVAPCAEGGAKRGGSNAPPFGGLV
jgi:hypothetical protein